jgi:hypothetical protein
VLSAKVCEDKQAAAAASGREKVSPDYEQSFYLSRRRERATERSARRSTKQHKAIKHHNKPLKNFSQPRQKE